MSTFTPNKNLELVAHNGDVDTWDAPTNANWSLVDLALGGSVTKNATGLSGAQTLLLADYQNLTIIIGGVPTAAITYVVPAGVGGFWVFTNTTTGGQTVGIASAAGGGTITVPANANTIVSCDGSATGMILAVNVPPAAAGSNQQVQFNNGGTLGASANLIFDGTILSATGLSIGGNTTLGNSSGNNLQLLGATISIPNGLNIASNNLVLNGTQVGIGTGTLAAGNLLTVAGNIKITTGGLIFSDSTQLLSAAALAPGGVNGNVQFNNGSGGFTADSTFTYNSGTHTLSVQNLVAANISAGSFLTGAMVFWPGDPSTIPAVALTCDGSAVSRTTYSALFAKVGTIWGVGNGSSTFNLPDFRGRTAAGQDSGAGRLGSGATGGITGAAVPGATGGEQSHTQTITEMPNHSHTVSGAVNTASAGSGSPIGFASVQTTSTAGSGAAMNNTQPTGVGTWIIYT